MLGCWCCAQANRNLAAARFWGFDSLRAGNLTHILSHVYTLSGWGPALQNRRTTLFLTI